MAWAARGGGWNTQIGPGGFAVNGEEPGVSKYNSGMLTNQRLHNLWLFCIRHWRAGEIDKLNDCLDLVFVELYADSNPVQQETIASLDKNIFDFTEKLKTTKNPNEIKIIKANLNENVKKKFFFLKTVEKKQGRGLAYKDEFEDDFD